MSTEEQLTESKTNLEAQMHQAFAGIRERSPLVHNITNYVAMDLSANTLLALGASPAMIHAPQEAADFAKISSAVVLNIGTLSESWVEAMEAAAAAATGPVVLDPVGAGATPYRTQVARNLVDTGPALIRGNASEVLALMGEAGESKGVDATTGVETAEGAAKALAKKTGGVVAVTGERDFVTDGTLAVRVLGGHVWMTQVTAVGCALTAACAAAVGASPKQPLASTVAALAAFKLAGTKAAKASAGPASFRVAFVDALANLCAEDLRAVGWTLEAAAE